MTGLKVLGVGCGDDDTAVPTAKRVVDVLGNVIATNLVEAGNKPAKQPVLANCLFQAGDASNHSYVQDTLRQSEQQCT